MVHSTCKQLKNIARAPICAIRKKRDREREFIRCQPSRPILHRELRASKAVHSRVIRLFKSRIDYL